MPMRLGECLTRAVNRWRALVLVGVAISLLCSPALSAGPTDRDKASLVGPVMTVEESQGNPTGPPSLVVVYSPDGQLVQQAVYFAGNMTENSFTVIDPQGRRLRRSELRYGVHGEPLSVGWSDADYSYDGRGDEALIVRYGTSGARTASRATVNSYKGARKVKAEISSTEADGSPGAQTCVYEYDAMGRLSRELWYGPLGAIARRLIYSYDSLGRPKATQTLSADGAVAASSSRTYDGHGRVTEAISRGPFGLERTTYRFGPDGQQVGSTVYRDDVMVENTSVDSKLGLTYLTSYFRAYTYVAVIGRGGLTQRQVRRALDGRLERDSSFVYGFESRGNWNKMTRTTTQPGGPVQTDVTYRTLVYYPDEPASRRPYYGAAGRVVDEAGKGLSGVTIALSPGASQASRVVQADTSGNWFAPGLAGPSEVAATKDGWSFEPATAIITREKPLVTFRGKPSPKIAPLQAPALPIVSDAAPPSVSAPEPASEPAVMAAAAMEPPVPAITAPLPAEPSPAAVRGAFAVRPTLGYSIMKTPLSGPLAGLRATYGLGRFQVGMLWDRASGPASSVDWVGMGAGYAVLPRTDARLMVSGGIGYHRVTSHPPVDPLQASGVHGFAEMELKLGKDVQTDRPIGVELALGLRGGPSNDADGAKTAPMMAGYARVSVTGDRLLSAAMLAVGLALLLIP